MADSLVLMALEQLNAILKEEVALLRSVKKELEKLASTLTTIQAVLEDAEDRQVKEKAVTIWLEKLKDVAYEVDDILDEWRTEALKLQVDRGDGSHSGNNKVSIVPSPVSFINDLVKRHKIGNSIKHVREKLYDIAKEMSRLHLRIDSDSGEKDNEARRHGIAERETSSHVDESCILGREDDRDEIVGLLLKESDREANGVPIISIVGMGGLGKTTLAQLAYNNEKVKAHFDMKLWVYVSEDFDVKRITILMIESSGGSPCKSLALDQLQHRLGGILNEKRFLLVLDDIWNEDSENWEKLQLPFRNSARGSRIIITTRNENVALVMGSSYVRRLEVLSNDNCWLLFSRGAFLNQSVEELSELDQIGREIVKKCGGLPLAAKAIGSAMRSKKTRREWELVLESEIWHSTNVFQGILPALLISYNNLPSCLKQCFVFCAVFPKNWEIEKDVLIKLWMAQGFIHAEGGADMEEIGGLYFDALVRRCLLEDAKLRNFDNQFGNIFTCSMHDLVHDLAQFVAKSDCSIVEMGKPVPTLSKTRHCSLFINSSVTSIADNLNEADKLRTFLLLNPSTIYPDGIYFFRYIFMQENKISLFLDNFLHHSKHLRAVNLSHAHIRKFPPVGQLKHLRYLDLSSTDIEAVPDTVTDCCNLQTLKLNNCHYLHKLPKGMRKMLSLRHLEIDGTKKLNCLPRGIGRLIALRTLSKFIVGGKNGCDLGELKHLNLLRGVLVITHLERVMNADAAMDAELDKKRLHTLLLLHKDDTADEDSAEIEEHDVKRAEGVLESLRPHTNLQELGISGYPGSKFPKWMEDSLFFHLVKVGLDSCRKCIQLPAFGKLPSLKTLRISQMDQLRYIGGEFFGSNVRSSCVSFPKLESLDISQMPNLEEWELRNGDGEVMPSLIQLCIYDCPKLKALPGNLPPHLKELTLGGDNVGGLLLAPLPILPELKCLEIGTNFVVKSLPGGWLGQLRSLEALVFHRCMVLASLPEELQHLTKLRKLVINECPLLKESCKEGGEQWHKIAHIPDVKNIWSEEKLFQTYSIHDLRHLRIRVSTEGVPDNSKICGELHVQGLLSMVDWQWALNCSLFCVAI